MTIPKRTLGALAAIALSSTLATPSLAQSLDWSGFYVGAHAGLGWGTMEDVNNPAADEKSLDGFFGGLNVGYNYQLEGGLVLGLEADASFGDNGESWSGADTNPFDSYYTKDEVSYFGSLRARVGYAQGSFLPYVTGGLAWAETDHKLGCDRARVAITLGCSTKFEDSQSDFKLGWTVGGGIEYAADQNWIIKAEYLYTDLGENSVTLRDPNYPGLNKRSFDTSFSTVRLGVSYKF